MGALSFFLVHCGHREWRMLVRSKHTEMVLGFCLSFDTVALFLILASYRVREERVFLQLLQGL